MLRRFLDLCAEHLNAVFGFLIGALGIFVLKWPAQKRRNANSAFTASIDGLRAVIDEKDDHIKALRAELRLYEAHEAILVQRLRECEMRDLTRASP